MGSILIPRTTGPRPAGLSNARAPDAIAGLAAGLTGSLEVALAGAQIGEVDRARDGMELHVGRPDDRGRNRLHERSDVWSCEMSPEGLVALPFLDEPELVLPLGVLVHAVADAARLQARGRRDLLPDPNKFRTLAGIGPHSSHDHDHVAAQPRRLWAGVTSQSLGRHPPELRGVIYAGASPGARTR